MQPLSYVTKTKRFIPDFSRVIKKIRKHGQIGYPSIGRQGIVRQSQFTLLLLSTVTGINAYSEATVQNIIRTFFVMSTVVLAFASSAEADDVNIAKLRDCRSKFEQMKADVREIVGGNERFLSFKGSLEKQQSQLELNEKALSGISGDSTIQQGALDRYNSQVRDYNRNVSEYREFLRELKKKEARYGDRMDQYTDTCGNLSAPPADLAAVCGDSRDGFCAQFK